MEQLFKTKIHIRWQQQSARRSTTLLEGLDDDLDLIRICKAMRKAFSCNGTVLDGKIIQLQGNQKDTIRVWLVAQEILTEQEAKDRLVIHG